MTLTDFWANTNTLIKQQNKTQRGLAIECGFSERRIESLSSNNRSPDVLEAVIIANALNTTVEFLVTGIESTNSDPSKTQLQELKTELLKLLEKY